MVRTLSLHPEARPQPARILAIATAVAVHAFAFLLLLVPMATPAPERNLIEPKPVIDWWLPTPVPVTPTPPEPVPVRRPQASPQPRVAQEASHQASEQVIADQGTVAAEPVRQPADAVTPFQGEIAPPASGVQLEYQVAKAPPYPREAFRRGLQGQVLLKILVDTDGKPLEVSVSTSSGHHVLDDAARRFVLRNWRFKPAMRDGQAVQAYGLVPIDFTLQ